MRKLGNSDCLFLFQHSRKSLIIQHLTVCFSPSCPLLICISFPLEKFMVVNVFTSSPILPHAFLYPRLGDITSTLASLQNLLSPVKLRDSIVVWSQGQSPSLWDAYRETVLRISASALSSKGHLESKLIHTVWLGLMKSHVKLSPEFLGPLNFADARACLQCPKQLCSALLLTR